MNGELGELSFLSGAYNYGRLSKITDGWRGKIPYYSVVQGGGVHIVDLMHWLSGQMVEEVAAFGNNVQSQRSLLKSPDMVAATLKFDNGLVGLLSSNYGCVFPHFHQFEVYGTQKTFINGMPEARLFSKRDVNEYETLTTEYPGVKKGDLIYNFIEAIVKDQEPEISRKEIFSAMAVCFAVDKAVKSSSLEKVEAIL